MGLQVGSTMPGFHEFELESSCFTNYAISPADIAPSKHSHYQVTSSLGGQTRSLLSNESAPCRVTCLRSVPRKPLCGQCGERGVQPLWKEAMDCNDMQAPILFYSDWKQIPQVQDLEVCDSV